TSPPAGLLLPAYEEETGALWFYAVFGALLIHYDPATETFSRLVHDSKDPASLSDSLIWGVMADAMGGLWVATRRGNGLNRTDLQRGSFAHYKHEPDNPNSLDKNGVRAFLEDREGRLWVSPITGALNRFDRKTQTVIHFPTDPLRIMFLAWETRTAKNCSDS
ncbi:MAG: hypothetical protein IH820_02105, partial [Bacteroidetes bacterium]|nr:hypothetical protein [Bacteroidota bacterium]